MAATLKPAVWIIGVAAASLLLISQLVGPEMAPAVVAGMIGPLVAVVASWVVIDRQARRDARAVGRLMLGAFAAKALFFAAYVVVALQVLRLDAGTFIVSFTCYFIALYLTEALLFRRLFASMMPPPAAS